MTAKNLKLLVLSVMFGLVAAFVSTRVRPQEPSVTVLVAKQPIPRYTSLRDYDTMFTLQEFSGNVQLPPNHLKNFDPLKEKGKDYLIAKPMKAGEVLSLDYVIDKGQGGLAALLRPGYVGFAIRVAAESSVSGLISPDDYVKVISVKRLPQGDRESTILLKNIRVVAIDTNLDKPPDRAPHIPNTVTLELTDEETKLVRLAQEDGSIALALIPLKDRNDLSDRHGDKKAIEPPPVNPNVTVLVAREAFKAGTPLADFEKMFVLKNLPREKLQANQVYFSHLGQLKDRAQDQSLAKAMQTEEPLTLDYLVRVEQPNDEHTLTIVSSSSQHTFVWDEKLRKFVKRD